MGFFDVCKRCRMAACVCVLPLPTETSEVLPQVLAEDAARMPTPVERLARVVDKSAPQKLLLGADEAPPFEVLRREALRAAREAAAHGLTARCNAWLAAARALERMTPLEG